MSKKLFMNPFVLALDDMGDDSYDGGETSHWTTDDPYLIYPVSFADFSQQWYEREGYAPSVEDEYLSWWTESGFSEDLWNELNPTIPYPGG